jgi:hypothetical protein
VYNFHFRVDHLCQADVIGHIEEQVDFGVDEAGIVSDHGESNLSSLVKVIGTGFGNRRVKIILNFFDNRFYNASFSLEGSAFMQSINYFSRSDNHTRYSSGLISSM